jgi:hypothetical protein
MHRTFTTETAVRLNEQLLICSGHLSLQNPRFKRSVPIDDYVLDVLMRDLVGHDQKPAAFMVYLHLYGQAARNKWRHISASVRTIADATGLSKSAVHAALTHLRRRQLIATTADHVTATPRHRVLRHWRAR